MPRMKRDHRVVAAVRDERGRNGVLRCEVCGWGPPQGLKDLGQDLGEMSLVHAHHIVPLSHGGSDAADNMVLLCPNHHAIAHRLGRATSQSGKTRYWGGPTCRDALLHEMKLLQSSDKDAWRRWIEGGRDWSRHVADEGIRATRNFTVIRASGRVAVCPDGRAGGR